LKKKISLVIFIMMIVFSCKEKKDIINSPVSGTTNNVFDYANILSITEKDSLNLKIRQFELKTTNEIAVVTKDSITENLLLYSVNLANRMGIGKKDKDNGLLILLVKNSRQVRLTTGIGTEKILTDAICQDIIDYKMIAAFKNNKFYKGFDDALDEIIIQWTID